MGSMPSVNAATGEVLAALLVDPGQELSGLEVCVGAGLRSGTAHPILARLEGMGWVESRWAELEPGKRWVPPLRYYRLTGLGASSAPAAVARARRPAFRLRLRPAAGHS